MGPYKLTESLRPVEHVSQYRLSHEESRTHMSVVSVWEKAMVRGQDAGVPCSLFLVAHTHRTIDK